MAIRSYRAHFLMRDSCIRFLCEDFTFASLQLTTEIKTATAHCSTTSFTKNRLGLAAPWISLVNKGRYESLWLEQRSSGRAPAAPKQDLTSKIVKALFI